MKTSLYIVYHLVPKCENTHAVLENTCLGKKLYMGLALAELNLTFPILPNGPNVYPLPTDFASKGHL